MLVFRSHQSIIWILKFDIRFVTIKLFQKCNQPWCLIKCIRINIQLQWYLKANKCYHYQEFSIPNLRFYVCYTNKKLISSPNAYILLCYPIIIYFQTTSTIGVKIKTVIWIIQVWKRKTYSIFRNFPTLLCMVYKHIVAHKFRNMKIVLITIL